MIGPPTPVEINQLQVEFEAALALYREHAPLRVLEIGTAAGGTLYHWIRNAKASAKIVSVDLDMSQITEEQVRGWGSRRARECVLLQGDAGTPWTQSMIATHGPFDWVFIDGCHEYAASRSDWEAFRAMCNPGAYVLFHDIALRRDYPGGRTAGVHQLWREIQAEGLWTRELRADPAFTKYGIGVVRLP